MGWLRLTSSLLVFSTANQRVTWYTALIHLSVLPNIFPGQQSKEKGRVLKGVLVKVVGPPAKLFIYIYISFFLFLSVTLPCHSVVVSLCPAHHLANSRLVFFVRLQRGDASVTRTSGERWRTGYCYASKFQLLFSYFLSLCSLSQYVGNSTGGASGTTGVPSWEVVTLFIAHHDNLFYKTKQ